jgi:primosomal protein N' (replication factor Y)
VHPKFAEPGAALEPRDVALVDVFVVQRTARVDRPLTYRADGCAPLNVGDVVRVPLGARDVYGFVIAAREGPAAPNLRGVVARASEQRAFDEAGLELARWMAARYCCSLGEALASVAFAPALPRVVDRFVVTRPPDPGEHATISPRILRLVAGDLATGFGAETFLRHPEARRAGDRRQLLAALRELQRTGVLRRERRFVAPSVVEKRERVLHATGAPIAGARARALVEAVETAQGMRYSDALLAGYSRALIARALAHGALRETRERAVRARAGRASDDAFTPTDEQARAIAAIVAATGARTHAEILLQGITGSGKTLVYLRAIADVIAAGGRAIVLVPEISLTPQTARRFEAAFGNRVAVLHSALSERERFESWSAAARGDVDVVVGARSAVFAPLHDVRLIVIDEAHERTYKQESAPRYDALAVARERMRLARGCLVLGSATPPLETYEAALGGRIGHLRLDARATAQALPATTIVDLTAEFEGGNRRIFSSRLVAALGARLERGEKSVLFVNRRGSARFLLCRACGAVPECARCSVSLVAHRAEHLLRCHLCDAQRALPSTCPACGGGPIREFGVGTQTVANAVAELFPQARVVRMDSDTTTRVGDHARLLDDFATRGDVLVGTQMIAKGLDFPTVTLACVIAADAGLHAPDFRAAERTFDLITQVAGRSGRARPGEAIVQTYAPTHPAIARAAEHDFDGFAAIELAQRRELQYPPYAELVYLGFIGRDRAAVVRAANRCAELLLRANAGDVLGPAPYAIERVNDEWRYRIAIKAIDAAPARRFIRDELPAALAIDRDGVRLAVNADP